MQNKTLSAKRCQRIMLGALLIATLVLAACQPIQAERGAGTTSTPQDIQSGYADVNGLHMYSITAPTLLVIGDSEVVRPEHAVEFFHLLGGGVFGDLAARADWLAPMVTDFLDAPLLESKPE